MAALAALATLTAGCRHAPEASSYPGAPIVLISIDTLRSDHLPIYGYHGVATPAIDELRHDSLLFERAYSHYPMTLPSHVSLLTGELPPVHGVRDNSGYPFDSGRHPYLPRLLKAAGYETAAVVSSAVLAGSSGLANGFDSYDDRMPRVAGVGSQTEEQKRPGAESAAAALDWVRARAGHPFFLFLHLYEPHAPYAPPPPFAARYAAVPYDGEIAAADAVVGQVLAELKRLGLYERAIVVLLSDHGEGLGEHGEQQHGMFLYREALQVPLLLKLPAARLGGTSVAAPAQLIDLVPTLTRLAGVEPPAGLSGESLLDLAGSTGKNGAADGGGTERGIYSETLGPRLHYGWSELTSLIAGRWHLQDGPQPELFDLVSDPGEQRNRVVEQRRDYAAMRQTVRALYRPPAAAQTVDPETARKLASLGYAAGGAAGGGEGGRPDPRSRRAAIATLGSALVALEEHRLHDAAPLFEHLLRDNPHMADAQVLLARTYQGLGRRDDAARAYEQAVAAADGAPATALMAAHELVGLGRIDEARTFAALARTADPAGATRLAIEADLAQGDPETALAELRRAGDPQQTAPPALRRAVGIALAEAGKAQEAIDLLQPLAAGDPAALDALAVALADGGRPQEAVTVLNGVLAANPRDARAHQVLGSVAMRSDQPGEAKRQLELAVALDPRLAVAWNVLGVARYRLDGPAAALAAWKKAVEIDPGYCDPLLNIGLVSAETGKKAEARQALERFIAKAPPSRFGPDLAKARALLRELGS